MDASGGVTTYFKGALAHEFFHLEQYRTNVSSCDGGTWWFLEASATWAGAYFVPTSATQVYQPFYTAFEQQNSPKSLNNTSNDPSGRSHAYSAFIWPYFMQQQAGGIQSIGQVWQSVGGVTTCPALDQKLNAVASFTKYFKKFALENLDAPLPNYNPDVTSVPANFGHTYQEQVSSFPPYYPTLAAPNTQSLPTVKPASYTLPVNPSKDAYPFTTPTPVSTKLPALSAQYNFFKIRSGYNDVQFNFSKLPAGNTDVTLIGQEEGSTKTTYTVAVTPGSSTPVNFSGASAHVCLALDLKPQFGKFGQSPAGQGAAFWVVIDNHSLSTTPLNASYTVTVRTDCADTVSGTLTDIDTTTLTSAIVTSVLTENDTWKVQLQDSKNGFDPKGSSDKFDVTERGTSVLGTCHQETQTYNGSAGVNLGATYFYGFGPLNITPQLVAVTNYVPVTVTKSACGSITTTSGNTRAATTFCEAPAESSYATARIALTFGCSDKSSNQPGTEETVTGGGTLTATKVDACGLWTTGCSIKAST